MEFPTQSQLLPGLRKLQPLVRPFSLGLLAVISCGFILLFYFIAFSRLNFPLQLEWVECGILDGAYRVLHHQALYVKPTYEFVTDIYTPVYSYAGALAIRFGGPSLRTLRVLSIASTTGCLLVIFWQTRNITRNAHAALLACGLFAALYGSVDGWYDIARVDMLCLFLTLLAIGLSWRGNAIRAGLTFALAYQTKQGAALIAVCVLLHEIGRPRKLVLGLASFFAATFASIYVLNQQSHGWYGYYTLFLPGHQPLVPVEIIAFFTRALFSHLGLALTIILFGFVSSQWQAPAHRRLLFFLLATTIGTAISALSGRVHSGGSVNAMLPLYAWIAILFGIGFACVLRQPRSFLQPAATETIFLLMTGMQLCQLLYPLDKLLPSHKAEQYAQEVMNKIAAVPGDVYVLNNSADLTPIGKQAFANTVCIWDVVRGDHGSVVDTMNQTIANAVAQQRFAAIVSNGDLPDSPASFKNYEGNDVALLDKAQAAELEKFMQPDALPAVLHLLTRAAAPGQAAVPSH